MAVNLRLVRICPPRFSGKTFSVCARGCPHRRSSRQAVGVVVGEWSGDWWRRRYSRHQVSSVVGEGYSVDGC